MHLLCTVNADISDISANTDICVFTAKQSTVANINISTTAAKGTTETNTDISTTTLIHAKSTIQSKYYILPNINKCPKY